MGLAYLRGVTTLRLDDHKCTSCGICIEVCPQGVFSIRGNKVTAAEVDSCIECGACALNCPFDALSVKSGAGCAKALLRRRPDQNKGACGGNSRPAGKRCCGNGS